MKIFKFILTLFCFSLFTEYSFAQYCDGCTINVSASTFTNYTISSGQQLCIDTGGIVNGDIILDGGKICNNGSVKSNVIIINEGEFNNYGTIIYANTLELKNSSQLQNYGLVEVSNLLVGRYASYISVPEAKLSIHSFPAMPLMINAGFAQTVCSSKSTLIGGQPAAMGGKAPYTYNWAPATGLSSTAVANPSANPSSTTTYTLTVTDVQGRIKTSTITLTVIPSPVANAGSLQTVCKGTLVNLGGSPTASGGASPYKYVWTYDASLSNDTVANPTATPTVSTTYVLTVIDNNGCYATASKVVTVKPEMRVFAGNDTAILKRDSVLLGGNPAVTYGTAPFTYSWSPSTGLNSSTIANPKGSPSSTTSYILTVTDVGGCGNKKDTVIVTVDPNHKVYAGADVKICVGDTVTLGGIPTAKGGTLPYTYSWNPSTGLTSATVANPKAFPSSTTSYILTVTDGASIVKKDTVVVTVNPKPTVNAGPDATVYAQEFSLGGTTVATGGKPPYQYYWTSNTGNPVPNNTTDKPAVKLNGSETFYLTVTDSNRCKGTDNVVITFDNIYGSVCNLDTCTWILSGLVSTNYTVGSGQKLCIRPTATVTGNITLNNGGKICNSGKFQPASFTYNGGSFSNNSTGNVKIMGSLTMSSTSQTVNDGNMEVTGNVIFSSGSLFQNFQNFVGQGTLTVQSANFENTGNITLNSTDLIVSSTGFVSNPGAIMKVNSLKNSGNFKLGDNGIVYTTNYYNYSGATTGKITTGTSSTGGILVCSITENYGTITDSVDICDKSPSAGPVFLDVNSGTVSSTVSFCRTEDVLEYSSEVCGSCPTVTLQHDGCEGNYILFTAVSTKTFDNYEFLIGTRSVQNSANSTYLMNVPAFAGDTITVIATDKNSPCQLVTTTWIIPTKPVVTIAGDTVAVGTSVTLTASGASTYQWNTANGTDLGTGTSKTVYPTETTTYIVTGTNSSGCVNTAKIEVKKPMTITYITEPAASLSAPNSGKINLSIQGGKPPYKYVWNTGSKNNYIINAAPGTYSVTVTDENGITATKSSMELGYAPNNASAVGIEASGNSITKTAAGDNWGTAGTSSVTAINSGQNGWASFTVGSLTDVYSVGLSSIDNNGGYTTIDNAINLESGILKIYEKGVLKSTIGAAAEGDILKIERSGSTISYKKNGTQVYASTANPSLTLTTNTAIYTAGGIIRGLQGGFSGISANLYYTVNSSTSQTVFPVCNGDVKRNFTQTITYDLLGNKIAEKKSYFNYIGNETQTQIRNVSENTILATQIIYDQYNRAVISTLPATINQSDMCYKENFVTSFSGQDYLYTDFNVPNYTASPNTVTLGEVDNPKPVSNATPGTLGWYYSNNNMDEPFVPASSFPYIRAEYDDFGLSGAKRTTLAGEQFTLGSGHESQNYTISSLNELDYLYGKNKSWILENYSDPNYDGQGTITPATLPSDYRIFKSVFIDQNGQENIYFADQTGKIIAGCLSGQVDGANVNTWSLTRTFPKNAYADIHLPKGCETSLTLNNGGNYTIFNLKTNQYVKFASGNQFTGTTPNLPAGIYRITPISGQLVSITQNVNYYNFAIKYYDKAGNLSLVVPPEGIDKGYIPNTNNPVHKMIQSFERNSMSWQLSGTSPDAGITLYMYRNDGKIKFFQDARQRNSNSNPLDRKFSYVNYDEIGRIVEYGEYDPTATGNGATNNFYFDKLLPGTSVTPNPNYAGISTILESTSQSGTNVNSTGRVSQQSYKVYDVYTGPPLSGYKQEYLLGKVSKSWNNSKASWYGYDELGRMVWEIQQIQDMPVTGSIETKTVDYVYNVNGNVSEIAYQKDNSNDDFYHYFEYDADGRLKRVLTSTDAGLSKQEIASYKYYKHGTLKRKELGNKIQGVDYVYTINGWLKSINNPDLSRNRDPGKDGLPSSLGNSPTDLFGITLDYFSGDYIRSNTLVQTFAPNWVTSYTKSLYNGIIKGQRWKTTIPAAATGLKYTSLQLMNGYLYDEKYQLKSSTFGQINYSGSVNGANPISTNPNSYYGPSFMETTDYKVSGITYDLNGNIKTMNRNGYAVSGVRTADMDQMTYNYNVSGGRLLNNKLRNVTDAVAGNVYNALEFKTGQTSGSDNYVYDQSGQQIQDNSTDAEYADYDVYGKITAIYANSAKTTLKARFVYDEKGYRIKKTDAAGVNTWYIRDDLGNLLSTYRAGSSGLSAYLQTGVELYGDMHLGSFYPNYNDYVYELQDHLGNVRTLFNTKLNTGIKTYYDKEYKDDYLINYNGTIDYTENHGTAPTGKTAAVKVNAASPFGPGLIIKQVKTGQTLSGSYWYKTSGTTTPSAMMVLSMNDAITDQFINWDAKGVTAASNGTWTELTFTYTIPKDGKLIVYAWNNDPVQTVWFDDLTLNFGINSGVPEANSLALSDYYPHGSLMPGRNYASSYSYRFSYQGQFAENDPETTKNNFELRQWNGLLGRWSAVDPYREYHSPYSGMGNNSVNMVDPDGGDVIVLNASHGAMGFGHNAILVGNDETGWLFISKEGRAEAEEATLDNNPIMGGPPIDRLLVKYKTFKEFQMDDKRKVYDNYIRLKSDPTEDARIALRMLNEAQSRYNLLLNNCGTAVMRTLEGLDVSNDPMVLLKSLPNSSLPSESFGQIFNYYNSRVIDAGSIKHIHVEIGTTSQHPIK